ncbi:hypothetical protein FA10DRAFT_97085 [Acaromyces ingoldii]|uniref:Uncharacterized protein n=1 Tax=Acaromyces ingoldii TaxID=215250 RepID=A0A316YL39_9BASI|nr:hypothetical protein FA10DRAFT_97085 [Acaromyces ingoldii]PWN89766.1 hypothetical protein FA10DRAFT_97085 [Acaromyces ingoldii]
MAWPIQALASFVSSTIRLGIVVTAERLQHVRMRQKLADEHRGEAEQHGYVVAPQVRAELQDECGETKVVWAPVLVVRQLVVALLAAAILAEASSSDRIDFRVPISQLDDNFRTAQKRDSVLVDRFHVSGTSALRSIDEIINNGENGLAHYIRTRSPLWNTALQPHLGLVERRASCADPTLITHAQQLPRRQPRDIRDVPRFARDAPLSFV